MKYMKHKHKFKLHIKISAICTNARNLRKLLYVLYNNQQLPAVAATVAAENRATAIGNNGDDDCHTMTTMTQVTHTIEA